jgi:hypothetical protein
VRNLSNGPPGGDESRRLAIETRARAEFWAAEYDRRATLAEGRLAAAQARLGPVRRLLGAVLGAGFVYAVATRAAARGRALRGRGQVEQTRGDVASTGVALVPAAFAPPHAALARRAQARRRLARVQWRLRIASALGRAGTASRPALRGGVRGVTGAALAVAARARRRRGPPPRVTAIVTGDRLARARSTRVLEAEPGVWVTEGAATATTPFVLVTHGLTGAPRGWLATLAGLLEADPSLAAVAAVARDAQTKDVVDGGWSFDVREGAAEPVAWGPGAAPSAIGGTCLLLRAVDLREDPPPRGDSPGGWALDRSLTWTQQGRGLAVAPVEVEVEPGTAAVTRADVDLLCRRWGPVLRRRGLHDLIAGGAGRALRVHAPNAESAAACRAAGWEVVAPATADVALEIAGDGALLAAWATALPGDEPGAEIAHVAPGDAITAGFLRAALLAHLERGTVCLHIGARDREAAATSGDRYLASALSRALRRRGVWTTTRVHSEVDAHAGHSADVLLHVRGRGATRVAAGQHGVLWMISHPDEVTEAELERYTLVLVASEEHAEALAQRVTVPVRSLLQFTDPAIFHPDPAPGPPRDLVFVGNWRSVVRRVVWDALDAEGDLDLYGQGWHYVAPEHTRAEHIPNAEVHRVYSSARMVLADHWDDMRQHGFVSNRVCDALACGAFVICDDFPAVRRLFGDGLVTYHGREDLREHIARYRTDDEQRGRIAARGRELVLRHHTVDQRAAELLLLLERLGPVTGPERPTVSW